MESLNPMQKCQVGLDTLDPIGIFFLKKEGGDVEVMTDRQTDKQTEFQLVDSTPPVGGVE